VLKAGSSLIKSKPIFSGHFVCRSQVTALSAVVCCPRSVSIFQSSGIGDSHRDTQMKVFISWSGDLSGKVAELLASWLKDVLQGAETWLSKDDIDKGKIWFTEVTERLKEPDVGILCITRANKDAPWILFEAGALSKGLSEARVCPFLVDVNVGDLVPPLSQFNCTLPTPDEVLKLVKTINAADKDHPLAVEQLTKAFNKWWPEFQSQFTNVIAGSKSTTHARRRSDGEKIEEILELTRSIQRLQQQLNASIPPKPLLRQLYPAYVPNVGRNTWLEEMITSAAPPSDFNQSGLDPKDVDQALVENMRIWKAAQKKTASDEKKAE
jgi:hypothetical protein